MLLGGDCMSCSKELEKNKKWYERQWKVFNIRFPERGKPLIRSIVEDQKCPECGRYMTPYIEMTHGCTYIHWSCDCGYIEGIEQTGFSTKNNLYGRWSEWRNM